MIASKYMQVLYDVKVQIQNIMSLISMSSSLIQVASNSTTEMMASCQVGLLMIGQIFASSSELECPVAHASHEVVDWAVTHCTAIHGCDSSSTVEWSKRVHTCQVEVVIYGGVYGCVWWWHGVSMCILNGAPKLPPFHSQSVWQTSPFLETLCHGCRWWVARPAYLLVFVYLFSWSLQSASQTRRRSCRPSWM